MIRERLWALLTLDTIIIMQLGLIALGLLFVHVPESNEKYLMGILSALFTAITGGRRGSA